MSAQHSLLCQYCILKNALSIYYILKQSITLSILGTKTEVHCIHSIWNCKILKKPLCSQHQAPKQHPVLQFQLASSSSRVPARPCSEIDFCTTRTSQCSSKEDRALVAEVLTPVSTEENTSRNNRRYLDRGLSTNSLLCRRIETPPGAAPAAGGDSAS